MTGRHQPIAESFSKQELQPINTIQTLPCLCKISTGKVAKIRTLCCWFWEMKRRERTQTLVQRRPSSVPILTAFLLNSEGILKNSTDFLKHRQSYSLVKTPLYSYKNLRVVWPAEANATPKNK